VSDAVFKQPVKIGDTVRVEGKISSLTKLDDEHGLVETTLRILNQDDRLVARLRAELVWR
jgi:acyl dehydratase